MDRIILASASPRRKLLLEWAEVPIEIRITGADETVPAHTPLEDIPVVIARRKAEAVLAAGEVAGRIVLAADTLVMLGELVLGKPTDEADACRILSLLSGKTHRVITGVVIRYNEKEIAFAETTEVIFHDLTEEGIRHYVTQYKPMDKAGAYAIQEWIGVTGIKAIRGDFYNVMGLPVSRVVRALAALAAE